ncbi:hypothetical protein CTAM01_09173 [Colletotrichum tamarilloi]|uniref:Uncharacterized protein n=1 Tax=Colletotrichum tamarilloi TaxID=1209934 RepID=A0ABQ9R4I3_9PEZI|nr:uncharacterized protein CTAM01_09173 [Colletotrichum tamarilloi]KAK1493982.1 hypothetical protein CTAM01_09173 [Colletotrichum tamarilloi]
MNCCCCCCRQSKLASDSPESPSACSKDFHPFVTLWIISSEAYPNQVLPACRAAVLSSRFFGDSTTLTYERSGLVSIGGSLMICMEYTHKRPLISSSRGVGIRGWECVGDYEAGEREHRPLGHYRGVGIGNHGTTE